MFQLLQAFKVGNSMSLVSSRSSVMLREGLPLPLISFTLWHNGLREACGRQPWSFLDWRLPMEGFLKRRVGADMHLRGSFPGGGHWLQASGWGLCGGSGTPDQSFGLEYSRRTGAWL